MSDLPSTDFDNELELTIGTDVIPGQDDDVSGDDLILGEVSGADDAGLNTLNGSDQIDAEDGVDTLRLAASGDDSYTIGNFTLKNTEVFELRSTAYEIDVNLAFAEGVETLWFNQNYGDMSTFSAVQGAADIVISGGDSDDLNVDFANSVVMGSLDVLVDGADADLDVNDDSGGMIEQVNISTQGGTSYLDLDVYGQKSWTITGDSDLFIDERGSSDLVKIDATAFTGSMLDIDADMGNNGAADPVTAKTSAAKDTLDLDGDYYSDVVVKTAKGGDNVDVSDFDNAIVKLGQGHDTANISVHGDLTLGAAQGKDTVTVNVGGDLTADMGLIDNKTDILNMNWVGGDAYVQMGDGGVNGDALYGSVGGDLTADLGDGNNFMGTYTDGDTQVTALGGDDYGYIATGDDLVADFGHGNNDFYVYVGNNDSEEPGDPFYAADIKTRSGDDFIRADVQGNLKAALGGGDDVIGIPNVEGELNVSLGGGNDQIRTGFRGIDEDDKIDGGDGDDTLFAGQNSSGNGLALLNGEDDFDQVSGIETVSFTDNSSQNVEFNGEMTGANAAGIGHYVFDMDAWAGDGSIESNYDLLDMAGGVTLDIGVNSDYLNYFNLDLVTGAADKSANINFFAEGHTTFSDVGISNTETLNITLTDVDTDDGGSVETVVFGEGNTFLADDVLETLDLSGDAAIRMEGIDAESLSMIDGSGMMEAVSLSMVDVADDITIQTGEGDDYIIGDDADTAYDVETGMGEDYVALFNTEDDTVRTNKGDDEAFTGAGKDSIYLGIGDDRANFSANELTSADLIDGGDGYDMVYMLGGALTGNDAFFYQWNDVEELNLASGDDNIQLNSIASDSGMVRVDLSRGGNDVVKIGEGFETSPFEVALGDTAGDMIKVDARDSEVALTITGGEAVFTVDEILRGGTGSDDEIIMTATAGDAVFGAGIRGFESIIVKRDGGEDVSITTDQKTVAAGERLLVDASDLVGDPNGPTSNHYGHAPGDLTFDGLLETNGAFDVIGGQGNDTITTGTKADTVSGGLGDDTIDTGNGNDTVNGGEGDDTITTGKGADIVNGDQGDDTITTGKGTDTVNGGQGDDTIVTDGGDDIVNAGKGADDVTGGLGADMLTAGNNGAGGSDGATDTFYYNELNDSTGGAATRDTIYEFATGEDLVDVSGLGAVAFMGNGEDPNDTTGLLSGNGTIEAVFEVQTNKLWVDMNGDGLLDGNDVQIVLSGVTSMAETDLVLV